MHYNDPIGSAEAARILDTSIVNVCRWANSGYLPGQLGARPEGSGRGAWVFHRPAVQSLATARAEAFRVLGMTPTTGRRRRLARAS